MDDKAPRIEPLRTRHKVQMLSDEQLDQLQEATLTVLAETGVKFPSEKALSVFEAHGAEVDRASQVVKMSPELVFEALETVPRHFVLGARREACDLDLSEDATFFTNDGCGTETVDLETGKRRPSTKDDVGMMARVSDYLSSIAFYWPMVSAQDHGETSPLHELDAGWNNTVKHIQSETLMGARPAEYAVEMAQVISGSAEAMRRRPPFSLTVCTIAPLIQDKEGIEGAMVLAEAGIPVGFLAMPTLGTTAPATYAGAMVLGDAEVISAVVLMQLVAPGAPVFHSIFHAWADPRSGAYVGYPLDARTRYAPVEMAHHWGMPAFGGAFGTDSSELDSWQSAAEVACDPLLVGMSGAEIVTGIGLRETYTLLYPEAILLDDDLYHRARHYLLDMEIRPETLALDVIDSVGPGGHFLAQKHTREHMGTGMVRALTHHQGPDGKYRPAVEVARERLEWILENHQPQPLAEAKRKELTRILNAADEDIREE